MENHQERHRQITDAAAAAEAQILTRRQRWGNPDLSREDCLSLMAGRPWPEVLGSLDTCVRCDDWAGDRCGHAGLSCEDRTRWLEGIVRAPCQREAEVLAAIAARQRDNGRAGCARAPTRFITLSDLQRDTLALLATAPATITRVVAIARSGILPGSILATLLHLPLWSSTPAGFQDLGTTYRLQSAPAEADHLLLVDDTAYSGKAMTRAGAAVRRRWPEARVTRAVIYCTPEARRTVDLAPVELPRPHYLEWHLFNSPFARAAFDLDGILCHDIDPADDDDGPRYRAALASARPKWLARFCQIPLVITARPDRPEYRALTQQWLERYRVRVERLEMGPWATLEERARPGAVAAWKADVYRKSGQPLYIESCAELARQIARLSGRPVLCPAARQVYRPN